MLTISALLISVNWLVYIYAVTSGHIVAASLGYFLNPLLNVLLGYLFLSERLGKLQIIAVILAGLGVAILAVEALDTLWISITLALSFGLYGLVRKTAPVESLPGLSVETMLLAPLAIAYAIWIYQTGPGTGWGSDGTMMALLMLGALVTAVPLLLFGSATRKIGYGTIGFIQYIGPTIQFLFGVLVYGETLSAAIIICFVLIWIALAIFSWDMLRQHQKEGGGRGLANKKGMARPCP